MKRFKPYASFLKPVRVKFFAAIVAGVIAAGASGFGLPFMLEKVFPIVFGEEAEAAVARDEIQSILNWVNVKIPEGESLVFFACMMLPCVFLVRAVASFFNTYWINFCGLKVLEVVRIRTYARLQELSLSFHQKHSEGDLLSRILNDANQMQRVLVKVAADLIVQPFTLIWVGAYLLYAAIKDEASFFMIIGILSIPLCVVPLRFLGRKLVRRARQLQKKQGDMTAVVAENLASQREIRSYNLQDSAVAVLKHETSLFLRARMKVVKYSALISPSVELIAAVGVAFAIYYGVQNAMTLEKFIPLIGALYIAYEPIKKLGKVHGAIKTGEAALDRLETILLSQEEISEEPSTKKMSKVKGEVTFENVNFAYGEQAVLTDISVSVTAGQTIALVGPSGAGKSSFISLIPRFYDIQSGKISIDGNNIKDLNKTELRDNVGMVSQLPLLFSGTIMQNISLGKPGATVEEIYDAAQRANAHTFIENLQDGYETEVGERGEILSGGQRQRVAIARAFLKDAPILILDEATSALDTESEAQIQQSLEELSKGRTTFIIAHRFSSIKHADRILVFHNSGKGGEIVSEGSHEELYQRCGLYTELYDHQS